MKKGWLGILFCISFLFSLSGIKENFLEDMKGEFSTLEQNSNEMVCCSQDLPENGTGLASTKSLPSRLDDFSLNLCDYFTLTSLTNSPRGVSFSKPLKSVYSLQIHSSLYSHLLTKNSGVQGFHYCFVEPSCRYYIYTLRRIII